MTTPNWTNPANIPAGSANYDGLAAFAAKTQQDWEDEFKAPFQNTAQNILDGLWGDLTAGAGYGLTLVTEIVRQLIGDPEAVFTSITDALSSIGTWAVNLVVGGVSAILQQIDAFFSNIPNLSTWLTTFRTLIDGLLGITNFNTWVSTFKTLINGLLGVTNFSNWVDVFKTVIDFFNGVLNLEQWLELFKKVIDFFSGILNIDQWLSTFKQVTDFFKTLLDAIGTQVFSILTEIINYFAPIFTGAGKVTDWLNNLPAIGDVLNVIQSITGIAVTTVADGINQLVQWTQKIPVVGTLVQSILNGWKNPVTGTGNTLTDLIAYAGKLLTDESVVPTINLVGFLPPELTALIPVGHVGNDQPNLVTDGAFTTEAVIQSGNGWSWDGTTDYPGSTGGSAKVIGDGGVKQLFSNLIPVAKDQKLDLEAQIKFTKPSTATPTFIVGLRGYNGDTQTFTNTVASVVGKSGYTTASSSAAYTVGTNTTASVSGGWVKIAGSYTIPANCTHVRMLLGVTNGPNGTTVWFDDAVTKKTSLLQQGLIDGLLNSLGSLLPKDVHQALLDVLGKTPGANIATVTTIINQFLTGNSPLNGGNILSGNISAERIQELINTWVQTVLGVGGQTPTPTPDAVAQALSNLTIAVKTQTTNIQENTQNISTLLKRVGDLETAKDATPNGILARLTKLEQTANFSTVTPPSSGPTLVSVFDSFDGRTTMGGNWVVYETFNNGNSLSIPNSQDAQYVCPQYNTSTQQVMAIWNGTGKKSATTFQKIFATYGSAAGIPGVGTMGFNDLIGLANPSLPTQGIIWRIYADGTSKVFYRTTGLESNPWDPANRLGSFSAPISTATGKPIQPTTGMPVELYIGDKNGVVGSASNSTVLYAKLGGAILGPVPIGANIIASMGSSQGWGFGMGQGLSAGLFGYGASQTPATLGTWGAQDQS